MIRLAAEWEEQAAVLFCFPAEHSDWGEQLNAASAEIATLIAATARFVRVMVITPDPSWAGRYQKELTNTEQITLAVNDCWVRDYGPLSVKYHGQLRYLDFQFNGWGNKYNSALDNLAGIRLWATGQLGTHHIMCYPWVLEGGSIETDGKGTILTTKSCLLQANRNPGWSEQEIEAQLMQTLGAHKVVWLEDGYIIGDDTDGHIDTLVRFCDEQTIAYVQCQDKSDPHYVPLLKMEQALKRQFPTHHLQPLPLPSPIFAEDDGRRLPATYANFLITNGAVLLPVFDVKTDTEAIQIVSALFPDREVIPLSSRAIIHQHGSFHCLSMQLPQHAKVCSRSRTNHG